MDWPLYEGNAQFYNIGYYRTLFTSFRFSEFAFYLIFISLSSMVHFHGQSHGYRSAVMFVNIYVWNLFEMPSKRLKYMLYLFAILLIIVYLLQPEGDSKVNVIEIEEGYVRSNSIATPTRNRSLEFERSNGRKSNKILLLFWTAFFGSTPKLEDGRQFKWPFYYVGENCPVACELTTSKHRVSEASAIVFHSRDINPEDLPPRVFEKLPWILQTHENPVFTPVLRDGKMMSKFNYFVSYRLDSDFPSPEFRKPSLDLPLPFHLKKRLVLAVYTHCEPLRTHYMGEMKKYIKIDFYGSCLRTHKFLKRPEDHDDMKLKELLGKYKFALIFPNADCDYYVTEKIYNALSAGSVPVWLGTDKIDEILQWGNLKHSVIKVKDYSSPKKLAEYLHYLAGNETEYNRYLKWKYEGFKFPPEYYKSPIGQWWEGLPLYCRVCMKIVKDPKGHNGLPTETCVGKSSERLAKLIKF